MKNIAILGFGTVGQGVVEILQERKEKIENLIGEELNITTIMVNNLSKERDIDSTITLTNNFDDILNDDKIDIVVELTGAVEEGFHYIKSSLESGKDVVTANKSVISKYFVELHDIAQKNKRALLYEASVGGGIPIIKPLKEEVLLNHINSVQGILNGTCNYILSRMFDENQEYLTVLKDAQDLGYAEADPSADVDGVDTLRKLRILSSIAFNVNIQEEDINCSGISSISKIDVDYIKNNLKSTVKLLACSNILENGYTASVEPTIIPDNDYFAFVDSAFNSISFNGNNIGPLKFYGYGAGKLPTGDAVCRDIVDILLKNYTKEQNNDFLVSKNLNNTEKSSYYLRVNSKYKNEIQDNIKNVKIDEIDNNLFILIDSINKSELIDFLKSLKIDNKDYFIGKIGY